MDKRSAPRRIEYRWFVAGAEVTPEEFWNELKRMGGRAVVETVDLAPTGTVRVTEAGRAALERRPA